MKLVTTFPPLLAIKVTSLLNQETTTFRSRSNKPLYMIKFCQETMCAFLLSSQVSIKSHFSHNIGLFSWLLDYLGLRTNCNRHYWVAPKCCIFKTITTIFRNLSSVKMNSDVFCSSFLKSNHSCYVEREQTSVGILVNRWQTFPFVWLKSNNDLSQRFLSDDEYLQV